MHSPLDSPAAAVAGIAATRGRLVVVTGTRGAGKTAWCSGVVEAARALGLEVAGLLSPHVLDDGVRVAIDLVDVATGERRRLAVPRDPGTPRMPGIPHWALDSETLTWGNAVLDRVVRPDLLVLDEVGTLEFAQGTGLTSGMRLTDERAYGTACVVVRPELLEMALARWPWGETRWEGARPEGTAP